MYIFENGRVDNIFTDGYYEKFTECLNDVVQKQEMAIMREGVFLVFFLDFSLDQIEGACNSIFISRAIHF